MERLTKRTSNGVAYMAVADTLSKKEQEIEGSKPILEGLYAMFQKLAAYEDAEEAGLLIKLPVEVGQKVWWNAKVPLCEGCSSEECIGKKTFQAQDKCPVQPHEINFQLLMIDYWGKTVFATKEEAEKALETANES